MPLWDHFYGIILWDHFSGMISYIFLAIRLAEELFFDHLSGEEDFFVLAEAEELSLFWVDS